VRPRPVDVTGRVRRLDAQGRFVSAPLRRKTAVLGKGEGRDLGVVEHRLTYGISMMFIIVVLIDSDGCLIDAYLRYGGLVRKGDAFGLLRRGMRRLDRTMTGFEVHRGSPGKPRLCAVTRSGGGDFGRLSHWAMRRAAGSAHPILRPFHQQCRIVKHPTPPAAVFRAIAGDRQLRQALLADRITGRPELARRLVPCQPRRVGAVRFICESCVVSCFGRRRGVVVRADVTRRAVRLW